MSTNSESHRSKSRQLDLGAGVAERAPGAWRADRSLAVRPDIVLNAEAPFPFRSDCLSRIFCFDLVEHVSDVPKFMSEIHRVLEPNGTVLMTTPHYTCANSYADPTHRHHFGWRSFDCFTEEHSLNYYSAARFEFVGRILRFHGGPIDSLLRRLANRFPDLYEHRLSWIFPAWYLEFELRAAK
jgi:SAM-dependent methyltransferase